MELKNKEKYPPICMELFDLLSKKLPEYLTYHCLDHTIDVANTSDKYLRHYSINGKEADLIRIAALAHDIGYLESPTEHEETSIDMLSEIIKNYDYSEDEIEKINGMIRATKIPQEPKNLHEEIIADSDLDYLGRNDYNEWSEKLFNEFLHFDVVDSYKSWLDLQIKFLENHRYHTDLAIEKRVAKKCKKLENLKDIRNDI